MQIPDDFLKEMAACLGDAECAALAEALESEPPTSVRGNAARGYSPSGEPVAWCENGAYLGERPHFTTDPLLHAGCYYVQEASSMFLAQAVKALPDVPCRVLDLCAAPGGKSTLWRSMLPDGALLVANEPVRTRANVLAENMAKWGQPDCVVTNAYPADFAPLGEMFDVVAADVPCSGEGMFRKDPAARNEWSTANVAMCAERQLQIVRDVWPALRPGGHLVYSTCTFNREENEENVRRIAAQLGATVLSIPTKPEWGVTEERILDGAGYHFYPHRTRGEGFFLALLRKDGTPDAARSSCQKNKKRKGAQKFSTPHDAATLSRWLSESEDFRLLTTGDEQVAAIRKSLGDDVLRIMQTVRTLTAGLPLATLKGRKWAPRHELALSLLRNPAAFPVVELTLEEAVGYLRREAMVLHDAPRGYVVVAYRGHALGFVNNLGARANNLYPAEWRIRHARL